MGKGTMIALAAVGCLILMLLMGGCMYVQAHNSEVGLRNAIGAKQTDNTSEFDNMWKKIKQTAQVTDAAKNALQDIFVQHAEARTTGGGGLMKWVQESVPNVQPDSMPFKNLMNIITASRDRWTARQKELLDLKREHDNIIDKFPSTIFVGSRGKIKVTIVTSSKTKASFESGQDDDVDVFDK